MKRLAAAVLALSGLVAGCGSGTAGDDGSAARTVAEAATRTSSGGPYQAVETATVPSGRGAYVNLHVAGTTDGQGRLARVAVSARSTGSGGSRVFTALEGDWARRGERRYARLPVLDRRYRLHGAWVVFDPASRAARETGLDYAVGSLGALGGTGPADFLRASTSGSRVGADGGLIHYRVVVDYGRYAQIAPASARPQLVTRDQTLARGFGTDRFPSDVWVDRRGRVARIASVFRTTRGVYGGGYVLDLRPAASPPRVPTTGIPMRNLAGR